MPSSNRNPGSTFAGRLLLLALPCGVLVPCHSAASKDVPGTVGSKPSEHCASSEYRQLDFWVGNWDVVDTARPTVVVAHARIESILNGCVLHEIYEGVDGHHGESFSLYDATRQLWHQTWVTDSGQLLTIEGRWQGQGLLLQGTDHLPDGSPRQVRGEWRSQNGVVHEIAARSTDGGVTWVPWFDLLFRGRR